jgi:hypothetical protein
LYVDNIENAIEVSDRVLFCCFILHNLISVILEN